MLSTIKNKQKPMDSTINDAPINTCLGQPNKKSIFTKMGYKLTFDVMLEAELQTRIHVWLLIRSNNIKAGHKTKTEH